MEALQSLYSSNGKNLLSEAYAEINRLRDEVGRLREQQTPLTSTTGSPAPTEVPLSFDGAVDVRFVNGIAVANGCGCASPEIYEVMMRTNWHGRLGRVHMADVDNLASAMREKLDSYLRHTINQILPGPGKMNWWHKEMVFASLRDLGLRLEDRSYFVDCVVFTDCGHPEADTRARMRNWAAGYYSDHETKYHSYWQGLAMETLVELARYRGLFTTDGMLKEGVPL